MHCRRVHARRHWARASALTAGTDALAASTDALTAGTNTFAGARRLPRWLSVGLYRALSIGSGKRVPSVCQRLCCALLVGPDLDIGQEYQQLL